jgi:serine/threonine-protein kinase HipA
MDENCTIQLFTGGSWHDIATVTLFGQEREGWRSHTYTGYAVEWAVEHMDARDAFALSCQLPVGLAAFEAPTWPVFLIDMLPQGYGREELLRRLELGSGLAASQGWSREPHRQPTREGGGRVAGA